MNWQSLLKTFVFNESEDRDFETVEEWKGYLHEVLAMWEKMSREPLFLPDNIHSLTEIYAIILEDIKQTEEYLSWDWSEHPNADEQIKFFERYLNNLQKLKEDMEWNFGDN